MTNPINTLVRIAILGDANVGKTCILHSLTNKEFNFKIQPTIGAAFSQIEIPVLDDKEHIELQIFDCAGSERFNSLLPMYLRGIDTVILVFSVCNRQSMDNILNKWLNILKEHDIRYVYCVGNKTDLDFDIEHILKVFDQFEISFKIYRTRQFLTSAKTGENIESMFLKIAEDACLRNVEPLPDDVINPKIKILQNTEETTKKLWCCNT